ncbi:hypothetical protein FHR99_001197 [Litorivivens lipolytica]|uniref:DUF2149 domain-containing protein n=1 Tax=Litorivivens lipolytica TaxID=1524264 RepID=A0A7W4W3V7_9GAMM|nr:DUF2149 domain-containing protein [Litorivivens lipolytica]MBB3046961.1 hypothetical protein [Litorivivens lipolytica]
MDKWRRSSFLDHEEDPLGPLANLVDIILVFACGLIAALVSFSPELQRHFAVQRELNLEVGRELPSVPQAVQEQLDGGEGYESLGQVYRDPETGKLILIDN